MYLDGKLVKERDTLFLKHMKKKRKMLKIASKTE